MYGTSSARRVAAIASLPHQLVAAAATGFSSTGGCDTARSVLSM